MIPQETVALIRHLFYAEHWKIGTIASELGLHYDTVRRAVETDRFSRRVARGTLVDPYADFVRETLASYPRLRATRIAAPRLAFVAATDPWGRNLSKPLGPS